MIADNNESYQIRRQKVIPIKENFSAFPLENIDYYRDIPCHNNLLAIYWIADSFKISTNDSDLIGAFILSWIKKENVELIKEKKGLFGKEQVSFKFKDNVSFDNELEQKIYNFVKNTTNNNILNPENFENWCSQNPYALSDLFDRVNEYIEQKFIEKKLYIEIPIESIDNKIKEEMEKNSEEQRENMKKEIEREIEKDIQSKLSNNHRMVIGRTERIESFTPIYRQEIKEKSYYECSEDLNQEAKKIAGLKKFIMDFSILSQRESIEVHQWEDYLIIAKLLGVANYVSKQFQDIFPDFSFSNSYSKMDIKISISRVEKEIKKNKKPVEY